MVEQYAAPGKIFAVVSDSYDIYNAVRNIWIKGGLLEKVKTKGATVVIRPDSGDPTKVPIEIIDIIANEYGHTVNSMGFKVLPPEVRLIQGDGITPHSLKIILDNLEAAGYSASNIAFGMGGGLLQMVNRDTYKFAMKCSAAEVDGEWIDVYKQPVTDSGKKSKRGRITLAKNRFTGQISSELLDVIEEEGTTGYDTFEDLMHTVYENGPIESAYESFDAIRRRAVQGII
jgi:nicotinamide phosphoribosyltransferase